MRSILATAIVVLLSSPAFAAACPYVNEAGDRLSFVSDGENTVTIKHADGSKAVCTWAATPDGPNTEEISCNDGTDAGFFFGSLKRGGSDQTLLIFGEDIWYRDCH